MSRTVCNVSPASRAITRLRSARDGEDHGWATASSWNGPGSTGGPKSQLSGRGPVAPARVERGAPPALAAAAEPSLTACRGGETSGLGFDPVQGHAAEQEIKRAVSCRREGEFELRGGWSWHL